jgi:predicted lipid-binding transport protein (Tim44 family)
MQDSFDFTTIVFLLLAAFVAWRLYSVLGMRTGNERDLKNAFRPMPPSTDTVVQIPPKPDAAAKTAEPTPSLDRWKGIAEPQSPLAAALDAIAALDGGFDARAFLAGARSAYEMIVIAFAAGDRKALKNLLSRDVFDGFSAAITEREQRGEKVSTTFVSIDRAEIADAQLRDAMAHLTIRFAAKLITSTTDASGKLIDGASDKIVDITDVWTFAREAGSRDPNWRLVATEAGH